jgi:hypothetical protein
MGRFPSMLNCEGDLTTDQLSELLRGLDGLQPTIEVDRCLNISVTEKATHGLIVARSVFQVESLLLRGEIDGPKFSACTKPLTIHCASLSDRGAACTLLQ